MNVHAFTANRSLDCMLITKKPTIIVRFRVTNDQVPIGHRHTAIFNGFQFHRVSYVYGDDNKGIKNGIKCFISFVVHLKK